MRSCTAEQIYSSEKLYNARSAGTEKKKSGKITGELILWSDIIFVMEDEHEEHLLEKFPEHVRNKLIVNLDIPDNYFFMDPELVDLIKSRVSPYLKPA